MSEQIKKFSDNSILEFDGGAFDKWCVYITEPGSLRHAPRDVEYFANLKELADRHTPRKIYDDFVKIFDRTGREIDKLLLRDITDISKSYGQDSLKIDKLFTILYAGMLAEQNKRNTRLGKKIKRLGLHQVLIEGMAPDIAANCSKGKPWRALLEEYLKRIPS